MNSYETLSEYYDRFTDDVGYEEWADFFERLFERAEFVVYLNAQCLKRAPRRVRAVFSAELGGDGCVDYVDELAGGFDGRRLAPVADYARDLRRPVFLAPVAHYAREFLL